MPLPHILRLLLRWLSTTLHRAFLDRRYLNLSFVCRVWHALRAYIRRQFRGGMDSPRHLPSPRDQQDSLPFGGQVHNPPLSGVHILIRSEPAVHANDLTESPRTDTIYPSIIPSLSLRTATLPHQSPSSHVDSPAETRELSQIHSHASHSTETLHPPDITSRTEGRHALTSTSVPSLRAVPSGDMMSPPPTSATPSFADHNIFPMLPEASERYIRTGKNIPKVDAYYNVKPMTRTFPRTNVPAGWESHVHPGGTLYFANREGTIITDGNLCDIEVLRDFEKFLDRIHDSMQKNEIQLSSDLQLAMLLMPAATVKDLTLCGYYFVDHQNRSVFWLDDFDAEWMLRVVKGSVSSAHIKHAIEAQYWLHCEYFPNVHQLSQSTVHELRGILVHSITDTLTSQWSLMPYTADQLTSMLNMVNEMKDTTKHNEHFEAALSRLMATFSRLKFINFHGEPCARLNRNESIHDENERSRSLTLTILSPLLFFSPDVHIHSLNEIFVDHIVLEAAWKTFIDRLNKEWQDFLLLGEVLLTVNVSLLAIPSVDTSSGSNVDPHRTLPQIFSYVSIVVTVGSIIMGLLLVRQNRQNNRNTAEGIVDFLITMESGTFMELETLAIIYSLPWALLMWGTVTFVAAFSSMCFSNTDLGARGVVSISGAVVLGIVVWSICTVWEREAPFWRLHWSCGWEHFKKSISHRISHCGPGRICGLSRRSIAKSETSAAAGAVV